MINRNLKEERMRGWIVAVALWLATAFSTGWYHTFGRFATLGWPLPTPEGIASYVFYRFLGPQFLPDERIAWFVAFPLVGTAWAIAMVGAAPYFTSTKTDLSDFVRRLAWCSIPIIAIGLVIPALAFRGRGVSFLTSVYMRVELANIGAPDPWVWFSPVYIIAALITCAAQFLMYQAAFGLKGKKAATHYILGLLHLLIVAAGAGALVNYGVRVIL